MIATYFCFMSTHQLYNEWSSTYDTVENRTRDLEKIAGQKILSSIQFGNVIELGCGTGKNTEWLSQKAKHITAVDLSEEMQAVAKRKVTLANVDFVIADISKPWNFSKVNLITCSLILEHIQDLNFIFQQSYQHLESNGYFYICELHPFKQYKGSKARFETTEGTKILECFTHHISDYTQAALHNGFSIVSVNEWFDNDDKNNTPRLVSFLLQNLER